MTRPRILLAALIVAASVTLPAAQAAQAPPAPPAPQRPDVAPQPLPPRPEIPPPAEAPPPLPPPDLGDFSDTRDAVRIGQDFTLAAGDTVRDAVVIFGNATVAGRVDGDLAVILGTVRLASTAVIEGDFVVVGGNAAAEQGAAVRRDLVVVGGRFDGPAGFGPGGEHVVIGTGLVGDWFEGLVPYVTRGLVWGRLIVPDLPWVWGVVALFFLLYLALNLLFDRPVRACAATLAAKPLTAFGAGLLVLLLVGPVCLLLAVSVIGLAVVPFVFCALLAGWIIGKVAVARWIGMSIVEEEAGNRAHAARSFVIGFALIAIAYMIPVLGIVTWAIIGVLGLGAAALAFLSAYRRENPKPVAPVPPPMATPPPVPAPYVPPAASPSPAPESSAPMAFDATPGGAPGAAAAAALPLAAAAPALAVTMPRAMFRDRLAAFVLDVILVAIAVNILDVDAEDVFLPFLLVYHIGFWTWKQTTVGGIICQLRVVRVDGAPLTFADALVRGLSAIFSLAVLFIGALWMLRDPDRQTWHDKIAGTYVVKVPRNWPL